MLPETKIKHAAGVTRRIEDGRAPHKEYMKRTYWRLKLRVIALLGGSCVGCGNSNPLVLTVNHLDNRRGGGQRSHTGQALYRAVLRTKEPHRHYDLRCLNCQALYEYETGKRSLPDLDIDLPN
jgi:hypothetical protein